MSAARDEVLRRVRAALADAPPVPPVERTYRRRDERPRAELLAQLTDRLVDYHAAVRTTSRDDIGGVVTAACAEQRAARIGVPAGLPHAWRPQGVEVVEDDGLTVAELDALDGVVTGCSAAIAETGTLVLAGAPADGRRALTLVPDLHVCVVLADQVVGSVPEGLAVASARIRDGRHPVTLVSGPSATSDIELRRVEGVHGPRRLVVVIAS